MESAEGATEKAGCTDRPALVRVGSSRTASAPDGQVDFFDYSFEELSQLLQDEFALPGYRAQQLFEWVYRKRVSDIAEMTNISKGLREAMAHRFYFPKPIYRERMISNDGTRKYIFQVDNGDLVEAVMIKQPKRMTLCVSSQVGCGMACGFCRTGTMGLKRNLRTSEILQQVLGVIDDAANFNDMFTNIVFMGMGEPLHNFAGVTRALKLLTDPRALAIGGRKITISSVGLVPAIEKFGALGMGVNLAVSLNATTDEVRAEIMPINNNFPIARLVECMRNFPLKKGKRITIEYVMLHGVNDSRADLERLPKLLRGIPVKVNLIPYNENAGLPFKAPPKAWVGEWQTKLNNQGLCTTIRWSKGADIKAACGQLATDSKKKPKIIDLSEERAAS